ncbi:Hydroxyacid-oxoacid transhydrogenase [Chelonia mydas]|uniref:Hydroxyacid-oxoacid transhydrogenase, mitochondrial n=1 Tax=Chelonia mydas TaxID=8469 RepID=M7AYI4_CHEMY|nr:Hydroxyacid-oxoacid transhydrogenase [Chelonia mydas]
MGQGRVAPAAALATSHGMAVSNIRYGEGVTKEVGMDLQNLGARKVCVMTDKNLCQLPPVKAVLNSLTKNRITFQMYDDVRVEPTDQSHGMSYPISGLVKSYKAKDYNVDHPLVPHGLSVVLTSPAVFTFTAEMCPERHLEAAEILGADIRTAKIKDAGLILADTLRKFLFDLNVDDGLAAIGYSKADIPALVRGTLPQSVISAGPDPARSSCAKLLGISAHKGLRDWSPSFAKTNSKLNDVGIAGMDY